MIRKIKFSNFYSFKDTQEISFLSKKKKTYDYFQSKSGDQITKIAGFVGANATGKTNVMRFLSFMGYFIRTSNKEGLDEDTLDIAFKTFFNNTKPSNLYIEFEIDNQIYFYSVTVIKNKIVREELKTRRAGKGARTTVVYLRDVEGVDVSNKNYFKGINKDLVSKIRQDISLLAFLKAHYEIAVVNSINTYFSRFFTNINEKGEINNSSFQRYALRMYSENKELKSQMEEFVCKFDLGLKGFDIVRENFKDGFRYSVKGIHSTNQKNNSLDFSYESRGTQSLFFTLVNMFLALKTDGILIIDEIEHGFHPEALYKLISYYIDECGDRKTQLIFSSHSLGFMSKLDMHQIYLTSKKENSESFVYRLNEVKNIRSDENYLAKYMSGAYGAFPEIRV